MFRLIIILTLMICANSVGEYIVQYDENGKTLPKQCWGSTGTCWCIYGTSAYKPVRGDLECPPPPSSSSSSSLRVQSRSNRRNLSENHYGPT